uniref:Putative beta-catenin-binding protein apc n=1 Tax=Culex tarsalis TaxID=7177 RepID=A0A1Q3FWR5_CULTA
MQSTQSSAGGADSSLELEDALLEEEDDDDSRASASRRKPHFLDYDNKPPAGLEDQVVFPQPTPTYKRTTRSGEEEVTPGGNRGTWPAATSASSGSKYNGGGRQNHSMYGDMSEVCPKMECVYSLLSMLGSTNSLEMSAKFMELSRNRETCSALRRSGCIPLLVQIIHNDPNETARRNARQSLNNVIGCHPDDKAGRREVKVLKLIEQLVDYSDQLRDYSETDSAPIPDVAAEADPEKHPIAAITTLMKISFDEEHRHAMCQLGALQTISTLIQLDHAVHGANPSPAGAPKCVTMRRYAGMILTNLTFGDGNNKSLLCSNKGFMRALVAQIGSSSDELVQVTASVLRNLSWRADSVIKQTLSEIGTVAVLARAAMACSSIENTLKAILSALWNLSNHCPPNRSEFCEVPGALEFLIDMLSYEAPSKTMHVIENAGGILRNVSSHVALREDYRRILRRKNCLRILLEQLKSPSLTVVSNACGTLGSLSGDCAEDQRFLRENGAIPMLRSLIYSKHKMISNGSSMALKNLLKPTTASAVEVSAAAPPPAPLAVAGALPGPTSELPSLNARKKKALEQELEEKFLPTAKSSCTEEKDVCTASKEEVEDNSAEDEDDDDVVSHSGVHIRLVADQPEEDAEKPVNYSLKEEEVAYQDYQETDIDQITDYSLRYAENQSEESEAEGEGEGAEKRGGLLAEEDSVRCYYTEGTPQIISSATSMSDLRGGVKTTAVAKSAPIPISGAGGKVVLTTAGGVAAVTPGCDTPDKPYNYCEEGTPDFSRDASLNVLEMSGPPKHPSTKPLSSLDQPDDVVVVVDLHQDALPPSTPGGDHHHGHHHNTSKQVSFLNTAEETPLMFSRTSSMGSLSSAEPALVDDKSSIVSEFSRFPSGVISPSELPDSPTQSMPHSPRRSSVGKRKGMVVGSAPPPVKSAFEDTVAKFEVENTPAAFSCATSLSNLSLEEREDQESKEVVTVGQVVVTGPPVLPIPEVSGSDDGESDAGGDDDLLLQSMVSMGMKKERPEPPEEPEERDQLRQFCTEDTPARLSEAPSNCDLSVLSFDTRNDTGNNDLGRGGHDSDDSSNVSAEQSDALLEECIRSGMPQPKAAPKENPLGMMRRNPVHLVEQEPLYANDEVNNFYLEDSPYAFSTISGLSDLTVATEAAPEGRKQISTLGTGRQPQRNGSLSSLSVESDADDRLLDEAIAAGIGANKQRASPTPVAVVVNNRMRAAAVDGNDSLDSIDSVDSNDPQGNSLLEQCIANGMKKPPAEKQTAELRAGMNFAQLARGGAVMAAAPTDLDSIPDSDRDYDLLRECIARGMPRNASAAPPSVTTSGGGVSTLELTANLQRLAIASSAVPSVPKNVDTTPVVVTRPDAGAIRNVTSAGVVEPAADNTLIVNGTTTITIPITSTMARSDPGRPPVRDIPSAPAAPLQQSGSELDRSNEFPATAMLTSSSNLLAESLMQMSNEFTADLVPTSDKHKDPDLMLKSVERLTQELVSTAASKAENSTSNNNVNTWDEDVTCANDDVSFPSLSVQAPKIQYSESVTASVTSGSMSYGGVEEDDTATISDEIDSKALDALEDQTPMNEERPLLPGFVGSNEDLSLRVDEIHFQLGGEVKHPMVGVGHHPLTHGGRPSDGGISFSTASTLTNSTFIALEATKVANQLQNLAIVESAADVDLSKINCPFAGSDSILISDCSDSELTFRNELSGRKLPTTIPAGLVARRALGQTTFNDSLNSLHNLDSIGPPSIMDELMDSMISVASITSEVVDLDSGHAGTFDGNGAGSSGNSSLTLNSSSLENLIKFSPTMNAGMVVTPGGNGGPGGLGCRSTPMSPKRAERRQAMKDRYKTYTIPNAAELMGDLEQKKEEGGSGGEEAKTPTPSVPSTPSPKKSSKERRAENKSRYETQVITSGSLSNGHHGPTIEPPESPRTPPARATIIATPVAFSPLTLQSPAPMSLERVLSPEDPHPDVDDDPATYTIQETTPRRKSFEQRLPTIASSTPGLPPAGPAPQVRTPLASPSKMPTPARIVAKINPPTPTQDPAAVVVKTVRGTKKPAYVSPYRKQVVSAPAVIARTPAAPLPAAKKEPLATPKLRSQSSLVETSRPRPQPLRARSSVGSKRNSLELNGTGAGAGSVRSSFSSSTDIPKIRERQPSLGAIGGAKAKVAPSPEPLLIRQGTFTKDEPTNPEVPVVTSAPSTPAKTARKPGGTGSMIPSSASSSRLTTIAKSRIVLHKSISMDASKTPATPVSGGPPPSGESTPLTSRFRLTSARTSLVDYKKPNTTGGRLSTPVRSGEEPVVPATPTSPGSMIPMRRKSGIALPKRTNLTMKSNPDVLKGKLEGVRNAFVRTAASGVKTGSR